MGTTHKSSGTNRRSCQPTVSETKRGLETTDWREILRVGNNRIQLRRPERILLPPDERCESHEAGHSSTNPRMDHFERCDAEAVCKVPTTNVDYSMYVRTESPELLGMSALSIRRTVLFNDNVAVFTPTDWPADVYRDARKKCWRRDRIRFRNRIKITEQLLGDIFSNEHRERVCFRIK